MQKIKFKILRIFLILLMSSLFVIIFVSSFTMYNLKNITIESNNKMSTKAREDSENALINLTIEQTKKYSDMCSDIIENRFESIGNIVKQTSGNIADIYDNPSEYLPIEYNHPKYNTKNELQLQWILPEGVIFEGKIKDETYLLGNIKSQFKNIIKTYPSIKGIYFTSKTGINMGYDNSSDKKPEYFDGRKTQWYLQALEKDKLYISDAYKDSFGRGLTVSVSYPCKRENGEFLGVINADIFINDLNEMVKEINIGKNGYAMLVSNDEKMISANGLTEENEDNLEAFFGDNYKNIFQQIKTEKNGFLESTINENNTYVVYSNINIVNWSIAIVIPKSEIILPASIASQNIYNVLQNAMNEFNSQIIFAGAVYIILVIAIVIFVIYSATKVANKISNPIIQLCSDVKKIGNGNLEYKSNINTNDEIEQLSKSFEMMTISLKEYIENLAKVTADKQRISTELNVANQIQSSMLPCIFPAFPNKTEFDVFATMNPAKEVGGDFYDFFLVGENKIAFIIADVSGKGIPAALFMMISKSLIKNLVLEGFTIEEVFEKTNNQLNENNDAFMFVTAFLAIVDITNGKMEYVNAGHNPPLIKKNNKKFEWLDVKKNCILAVIPNIKFEKQEIQLEVGDILFIYTDGVTEAVNKENEFYSENKLKENLNKIKDIDKTHINQFVYNIKETIKEFSNGAEQADDITILVFKYLG